MKPASCLGLSCYVYLEIHVVPRHKAPWSITEQGEYKKGAISFISEIKKGGVVVRWAIESPKKRPWSSLDGTSLLEMSRVKRPGLDVKNDRPMVYSSLEWKV